MPAHAGYASRQDRAVLVLWLVCQQAVVGDLNGLCGTGVSEEPADLLGAVGIFGNQLALQSRALHGQAALVVDQALGNGIVDPQIAGAAGQVGRDFKADGFAHGQAARQIGLLSDGSSCPEQGELADHLAGGGPPAGLKGAGVAALGGYRSGLEYDLLRLAWRKRCIAPVQ